MPSERMAKTKQMLPKCNCIMPKKVQEKERKQKRKCKKKKMPKENAVKGTINECMLYNIATYHTRNG
jgi:hypothetical protein